VQLTPTLGQLDTNLHRIREHVREAAHDGVDLLVLPELATSGYLLTPEEARACAQDGDDPVFAELTSALSERLTVVFGFIEREDETLYNSAVVLRHGHDPVIYRKLHLWGTEQDLFVPGNDPAPVLETNFGRLGILICYDLEFPEMLRTHALRDADVVAIPTNWTRQPRPEGEHAPQVIQLMAAARASYLPIVCCDRSGTERGNVWSESSSIIGRDGWVRASCAGESTIDAQLELSRDRRAGERNHALRDRRPEFYYSVEPSGGSTSSEARSSR